MPQCELRRMHEQMKEEADEYHDLIRLPRRLPCTLLAKLSPGTPGWVA